MKKVFLSSSRLFLAHTPLILSLLGVSLGILGYLTGRFIPTEYSGAFWLSISIVLIANGVLLGSFVKNLAVKGYTDPLTGLSNKGFMYLRLNIDIEKCAKRGREFSLAMIDIDRFKKINDTYGHLAGDMVLKEIAEILRENVRMSDLIIRWGGEEFAILLPETTEEGAADLVERIRKAIEDHDFGPEIGFTKVTISAGVVSFKDLVQVKQREGKLTNDTDLIVAFSDKALYKAKQTRNTVSRYSTHVSS